MVFIYKNRIFDISNIKYMSVRESNEEEIISIISSLYKVLYEKECGLGGNICIRFTGYKGPLEVIKDLLKGKDFKDFDIDYLRSNFKKYDIKDIEYDIKEYSRHIKIGSKFIMLYEPYKMANGPEENAMILKSKGLIKEEYNKGIMLYSELLNFHKVHEKIIIKGIIFLNKITGELSLIKVDVLPSEISSGKYNRIKNSCIVISIESLIFIDMSLFSKEIKKVDKKPTRKSSKPNEWLNTISYLVKKYWNVPNLGNLFLESKVLYNKEDLSDSIIRDRRYKEIEVNGDKLFLHTKDNNEIKNKKIEILLNTLTKV